MFASEVVPLAACPFPWLKIGCSLPSWKPVNRVDQLGSARVENVLDEYTSGRALPMADWLATARTS